MLNSNDTSEYLKISTNGLEVSYFKIPRLYKGYLSIYRLTVNLGVSKTKKEL